MKTKLGKILAIFVTVASIAFVGFAVATTFAKPTYEGVIAQEYFNGYRIAKAAGPDGQWSATRASDEGNVASSKVLAEVLTKVMDEILANHRQEITELTAREPNLEAKIAELTAIETSAEAAIYTHVEALTTRLAALRESEAQTGTNIVAATNEAQKLESTIEARRGDVLRLEEQVAELKADTFRLTQVETQLKDLLNQMRGSLDRADHRQQLLNGDNATYSPEPTQ